VEKVMNTEITRTDADQNGVAKLAAVRKSRAARGESRPNSGKAGGKSKHEQLITLLSKPNGARISVIVERLGWQAHTARAALSGLRKQDFEIVTSKSAKTGETIYAIVAQPNGESGQTEGAAS
jgi:Protein of unknown function (DUF3489)